MQTLAQYDAIVALKRVELRCAQAVASVHGTIDAATIQERDRLRALTGWTYDAVNGRLVASSLEG